MDSEVTPSPRDPAVPQDGDGAGPAAASSASGPAAKANRSALWWGLLTGAMLLGLGALAVNHIMTKVNFADVWAYLRGLPLAVVLEALAFTAAGYLILTLYDVSALRFLKIKVRYGLVALASFSGYAISNNVGWAVISGASVRYRVYSVAGLTVVNVAKVLVFSTTTFTLGVSFMGALGMVIGPHPVAHLLKLPDIAVQAMAGGTLLALLALCIVTEATHKPVRVWRWSFSLPSTGTVLTQISIASAEIVMAGTALWVLLPEAHTVTFVEFMGVYCAALAVAMVSHVPGGVGVFETIMLLGLSSGGSSGHLLGALLAYRFVYYVVPLLLAGVLLGGFELAKHRRAAGRLLLRLRGKGSPPGQ